MTQTPNQRLREWREAQKLTRTRLAADLGISENYVTKIENYGLIPGDALAILIEHHTGISRDLWREARVSKDTDNVDPATAPGEVR